MASVQNPQEVAQRAQVASVRIDVWLWSVRQVKSRSAATTACRAGHVRINGEPVKAATALKVGDTVRYRVEGFDRLLEVTRLIAKRVSAPVARECYIDHTPARPSPLEAPAAIVRDRGTGRPTKKERRQLEVLIGHSNR